MYVSSGFQLTEKRGGTPENVKDRLEFPGVECNVLLNVGPYQLKFMSSVTGIMLHWPVYLIAGSVWSTTTCLKDHGSMPSGS